jgi:hypothetical protein
VVGINRFVVFSETVFNKVADKVDIVPLDEDTFIISFFFGDKRINIRVFASD